jgi:hypothetical protein
LCEPSRKIAAREDFNSRFGVVGALFSNKTLVAKCVMDMPTIADKIVHRPAETEKVPCLITLKSEEQRISVEAPMHRVNAVPSDPLSHHGVTTTKTHAEAPLL